MSSQRQVLDLVDAVAERPFQIGGGYPKVHENRLGPRAARALQRRVAKGYRLPEKPQTVMVGERPGSGRELRRVRVSDHAPWKKDVSFMRLRPFGRPVPLADVTTLAVVMVAAAALIRVIGAQWAVSTAANMYMLSCFCGYVVLYFGAITAARQAIKRAAGHRWSRDAVEYVPWVEGSAVYSAGPDLAIMAVAEAICADIESGADTVTDWQPALDVGHELHEIAWSVAGLLQLRQLDAAETPHARAERTKLLDECRIAVLSRVVALYDYRLAIQRTRRDAEELQARRRAKTSTTADVATAAADEFLNRQAAARIAYLTEGLDITRVVSTHLVSDEMSTTLAECGGERSALSTASARSAVWRDNAERPRDDDHRRRSALSGFRFRRSRRIPASRGSR
jgi:hypothetical protein